MRARRSIFVVAALVACLAVPARAEVIQQGNLITSFDGQLTPRKLPRLEPAPISVKVAGDFKTTGGKPLPQLRTISVAINRAGKIYDAGLPSCPVATIQPATERVARALCHRSILGTGHVSLEVRLENQPAFPIDAKLLAFKGPAEHGEKVILAQVYAKNPPGAFVLTFRLKSAHGLFATVISTTLPRSAWGWAYLTHFEMTLHRRYRYRGKARSYASAACSAPAGFPGAVFPFAKARYGFANGQSLTTTVARSCRVR